MSRRETISSLSASIAKLSDERLDALSEIIEGWKADAERPAESDATQRAIAEGIAQADRGDLVDDERVQDILKRPWK